MDQRSLITGFPRIGEQRELKKALERYWGGKSTLHELQEVSSTLRSRHWQYQQKTGIDFISCNDFSWYDSMLDTAVMLNAIPERFRSISDRNQLYFAMARGTETSVAMQMIKWFNTNYHYIVPELDKSISFIPDASKIMREYQEAQALGINPKINLIGPLTFLGLSKSVDGEHPYKYSEKVFIAYETLLRELSGLNETVTIQFDEAIFARGASKLQLSLLKEAYEQLASVAGNIRLIVTTYFEHSKESTAVLAKTPIWGIGLDFVYGEKNLESLEQINDKHLIAGVVDGRNIWINNLDKSLALLKQISRKTCKERIIISSSCSLLHVPFSLVREPGSPIKKWLAFALEKTAEVALLARLFHEDSITRLDQEQLKKNRAYIKERETSAVVTNKSVLKRMGSISKSEREVDAAKRLALQSEGLNLPELPVTTIGSFPQTPQIRKLRRDYKNRVITAQQYKEGIRNYIDKCVAFQEEIGLDVLVHGEPERNDMVEYFGELLLGFHFTDNGWVQSYGSRCVKPPVIFGDVSRPEPMTVEWISYAQSKTQKPMKGMLTGPVTILNWSFVRDDKPRSEVSRQIALALSDEIVDLQNAGIRVIQVDEAAFKEGYPLRQENITAYETWAVENFKLAISQAYGETQIHTHMCYSDFIDIIKTIESMDADVITIETARSGNALLTVFKESGYKNEVGPGVYDIHSPRVPSEGEFIEQIRSRMEVLPVNQLWINPDCGLKTRRWEEVKPALTNMVRAAQSIRSSRGNS